MMRTAVIVLAVVGLVYGQDSSYSGADPAPRGGGPYQPQYGPNYQYEIQALFSNVSQLVSNDEAWDERYHQLRISDEANAALRDTFYRQLYPGARKHQAAQNDEIERLEREAKALLLLADEIAVIADSLDQVDNQLTDIATVNQQISEAVAARRYEDKDQENRLNEASADLAAQDLQLTELERRTEDVRAFIQRIRTKTHQVFDVLNSEGAETVEITVTSDEPENSAYLSVDFNGRRPLLVWSLVASHVSDESMSYAYPPQGGHGGSGSSPNYGYGPTTLHPTIYIKPDVSYDEALNKVTVVLYDVSAGGWKVEKVTVRVTVIYIDNRIITDYQ